MKKKRSSPLVPVLTIINSIHLKSCSYLISVSSPCHLMHVIFFLITLVYAYLNSLCANCVNCL